MPRDSDEESGWGGTADVDPQVIAFMQGMNIGWEHPDRLRVPASAIAAAKDIDNSSGRRRATPVRKVFVRTTPGGSLPPMAGLVQMGGRGGLVALKLYLALVWRCSGDPFQTSKPHRAWATLLGLEDPEGKGARRIAAATKALERRGLLAIARVPGETNVVSILDESADGSPYTLPSTEYARAVEGEAGDAQRAHNLYFKVPSALWLQGHIQSLRGPGLVLLLVLLAEQAGEGEHVWFSTDAFSDRYRISHKTRAAGTSELVERGLLTVTRQALTDNPGRASTFDRTRYRNLYELTGATRGG